MHQPPHPLEAEYRVEVRDRSGQPNSRCQFVEGAITAGFSRLLDDTSTAYVTVQIPEENEPCADCIPRAWDDLLVFYRADNPEPIWRGPVVSWTYSRSELTINAADGTAELGDRRAVVDHPALAAGTTPTVHPLDLVAWIFEQANIVTPLPLMLMRPVWPLNIPLVTAEIAAGDLLADALDQLSRDWIDWTVAGNRLWYGAPTILLPELPMLDTSTSWMTEAPQIVHDGLSVASEVEVIGAGGVLARYPTTNRATVYRPLRLVRENLTSQAQAEQLARDVWADSQTPQVLINTNGTLSPECPIAPEDLIPGRAVTVAHEYGGRHALYQQRIASLDVTIGAVADTGGWALAETAVEVQLQPAKLRVTGDGG